ncbi:hypothetical protein [Chelativorans sp. J32]|uniref:hypothetical protein n=1 Tax=Chelativorans sp. J32 TaxID=935840 RepID=UPI0004B332A3|nr:hypothetical protein [Chelativorans sp. J32]
MRVEFDGGSVKKEKLVRLGMGVVRVALLFGSAAIALAMILTPLLDRRTRDMAAHGIDPVATGSVPNRVFTIRPPRAICVVTEDGAGTGTGEC